MLQEQLPYRAVTPLVLGVEKEILDWLKAHGELTGRHEALVERLRLVLVSAVTRLMGDTLAVLAINVNALVRFVSQNNAGGVVWDELGENLAAFLNKVAKELETLIVDSDTDVTSRASHRGERRGN
eukprot:GDKI01017931.1.p2 GENE.GDKI01017931.1~~GDKI01017931.1.p2  ORF type:complete len:126 (-),score=31.64 GDKI01017931.1:443-820(-)